MTVKPPKVTMSMDGIPDTSPEIYIIVTAVSALEAINVEDSEVENAVGVVFDVQVVHEVVTTQRSEEPVSRMKLKSCALANNTARFESCNLRSANAHNA